MISPTATRVIGWGEVEKWVVSCETGMGSGEVGFKSKNIEKIAKRKMSFLITSLLYPAERGDIISLVRTFVAIELPGDLKEKIGVFEKEIEKFLPLRFVAPKNLHLTLFFLGEMEETKLPEVIEAVKAGAKDIKSFYLLLGKPEFFTHGLWFEVGGQVEVLEKLYQQISKELKTRNFELETRPFSAHITIGRARKRIKRIESIKSIKSVQGKFKVDSVTIFTSELKPEGPIYQRKAKIDLV